MEGSCSTLLEFGDFETKIKQVYLHDDCVELPPSWPTEDADPCKLSFVLPVENKFEELKPTNNNNNTKDEKNTPSMKEKEVDVICNGTSSEEILEEVPQEKSVVKTGNPLPREANRNAVDSNLTSSDEVLDKTTKTQLNVAELDDKLITSKSEVSDEMSTKSTEREFQNQNSHDIEVSEENNPNIDVLASDKPTEPDIANGVKNELNKSAKRTSTVNTNETDQLPNGSIETDPFHNESKTKSSTTWAGLFHSNANSSAAKTSQMNGFVEKPKTANKSVTFQPKTKMVSKDVRPANNVSARDSKLESAVIEVVKTEDDPNAKMLAVKLHNLELIFKPQAFMPRGLINTSNWCYINATLQALLVCPPFFQLLKSLPIIPLERRLTTSTPIMDSFIQLASEFRPLSTKRGYQSNKDIRQGSPFEPRYIYDMLVLIKSSLSERGAQEDAEEFQSCILNGLHEEMTKLFNNLNDSGISSPNQQHEEVDNAYDPHQIAMYEDMNGGIDVVKDEWEEVVTTKKNRSAVTRRADITKTPISEMFRGELCTTVFRPGQKASISYEPFFSLPLHVPSEHAWTVDEALYTLTGKEAFLEEDEKNTDATRQQTIETLPPVLILHLKRFVYDKQGGSKKIDRKMEYKTDLIINKDLLSKSGRKYSLSQRSYKLFAVVYHHGEKATGGHYTTNVFHIGMSSWLRIDDQSIWPVPHNEVTRHNSNRTAYLLYYRRTDLG
ncbi:unnamed protein product [Clavelina lepadiformis]|uniref:ubiquitinyl hydrolase 1 n=1 Tax=Clavelina lepadiformis TaxID=159417 RepID=A0ABP0GWQ7_CLALP